MLTISNPLSVIFVSKDLLGKSDLYATPPILSLMQLHFVAALGLPTSSYKDQYASPLMATDFADCLVSSGVKKDKKKATAALRARVKKAIKADELISVETSFKLGTSGLSINNLLNRNENLLYTGCIHFIPLRVRD